ncbi:MAG: pyridoxamine 5'-phosphate oxidase family protein [Methylobacillus sp.]|jgi:predicted pyridoxine 5'-phosphate oxidase superfamily flavin-nucleotide-binding protein|nr:pyridoxamine 5'-phosphate oxidase family protein [Methylobacillus sp.]
MIDDEVLRFIQRSVLCWLATVDDDGHPNVTPKEIFIAHDARTLLIANIASPNSQANILARPKVCVSFVDVFAQKGCKLKGRAEVIRADDARFQPLSQKLREMAGTRFPFASLFKIEVQSAEPIIAPSYRLYPETTEADQIRAAMRTYGVRPRTD